MESQTLPDRPNIAASACLLGQSVRYDGDHRRAGFVAAVLPRVATMVSICPEIEIGMGVPRQPIELVLVEQRIRLRPVAAPRPGMQPQDFTDTMNQFADRRLVALEASPVDGFVLKRGSPSCGFEQVKVRQPDGSVKRNGKGLFAAAVRDRHPGVPCAGEDDLQTPFQQFDFLCRVFVHFRFRQICTQPVCRQTIGDFHRQERFLLEALNPAEFKRMEAMVGRNETDSAAIFADRYREILGVLLANRSGVEGWQVACSHLLRSLAVVLTVGELDECRIIVASLANRDVELLSTLGQLQVRVDRSGDSAITTQTIWNPLSTGSFCESFKFAGETQPL